MNLWSFRFILWYICIMLVQPQIRFTFLWPLRFANLSFILAAGLHIISNLEQQRPLLRMGPGTVLGLTLIVAALLSQHLGVYQISSAWNPYVDTIVKNALLLIMVEALATTEERVWAVQMTLLIAVLWWLKGGIRLSAAGATYAGDRLMGAAVSLIDNPNGFAYYLCVVLPVYLYAFQRAHKKWMKIAFLACALLAVYIIFQTGSRTGLMTLCAVGAFLLPHYGRHHFKALAFIVMALVFIYPMTGESNMRRFRTIPQSIASFFGANKEEKPVEAMTQDEQSAWERKAKNRETWGLIKENFIFGVGIYPDPAKYMDRFPMATGEVHCEILMAGRQMGVIGMGVYVGMLTTLFFCGRWIRMHSASWPAVQDMGWTFQVQAVAIAIGGYFCPLPWNPITLIQVGSASALMGILRRKRNERAVLV